jgi:hypothetical protein
MSDSIHIPFSYLSKRVRIYEKGYNTIGAASIFPRRIYLECAVEDFKLKQGVVL